MISLYSCPMTMIRWACEPALVESASLPKRPQPAANRTKTAKGTRRFMGRDYTTDRPPPPLRRALAVRRQERDRQRVAPPLGPGLGLALARRPTHSCDQRHQLLPQPLRLAPRQLQDAADGQHGARPRGGREGPDEPLPR